MRCGRCVYVAFLGGIFFFYEDGDAECAMHNASCTFLALSGTEFTGNRATWSGGAIFVNEGNAVRIRCTPRPNSGALTYFTRRQFVNLPTLTSLNVTCPSWEDNSARQHGEIVGTYPELMRKWVFDEQANETIEIMGQRYIVHDHQSGFPIPDISIELLDAFGQGPVSALHNQTINATMWSPDRLFCCPEVVEMRDGRANFSGVYGFTPTGVYEVRIDFSDDRLLSLVLLVEIRGCSIGQVVTANGTFCQPCSDSTYNFLPQQAQPGCVPCPDDGICDNRAIRPENGYWHQTPCSRHIQECLTERACDQPGRDEGLQIFGANLNSCNFSEELIRTYMDAQCREVVLCQSALLGQGCGFRGMMVHFVGHVQTRMVVRGHSGARNALMGLAILSWCCCLHWCYWG